VALYWYVVFMLGGFRGDHLSVGLLILGLSYGGRAVTPLRRFLTPLILTGVLYDGQRYYPEVLRGRVHVSGPYEWERYLFGIQSHGAVLTPNEWWQLHLHPALDLVTGFFYLVFILHFVALAAYFVFIAARTGTRTRSAEYLRAWTPLVMWGLLALNVLGFVTHNVWPTAPPWYVARYGLDALHPGVAPDAAGAIRFDELLGTNYFTSFYGRSVDAFGAIPSLHVGYAVLALYYALRFGAARTIAAVFLVGMSFSAVYLNHHYVIDLLWAVVYALVAGVGVDALYARRLRRQASLAARSRDFARSSGARE